MVDACIIAGLHFHHFVANYNLSRSQAECVRFVSLWRTREILLWYKKMKKGGKKEIAAVSPDRPALKAYHWDVIHALFSVLTY